MEEYLITIAADNPTRGLSEEETLYCINEYGKWAESLAEKHVLAKRLSMNPGTIFPSKRSITTDGPFAEAKELIAGIIVIQVGDEQEAKNIAESCPLNAYFHLFIKKVD